MKTRALSTGLLVAALATMAAATVHAVAFSPSDISGMSFWFSPDTLNNTTSHNPQYVNGQAITVWDNTNSVATIAAGTSGRDAVGTGSTAPTYLDAAHGISGHASVRFDGVDDFLDVTPTGMGHSNTIFVVFRTTSTDSTKDYVLNAAQNLLGDNNGSTVVWGMGVTGGNTEFNGYSPNTAFTGSSVNNDRAHFFSVIEDETNITWSTDAGPSSSGVIPNFFVNFKRFDTIGAGYSNNVPTHGDFFTGDIAEIIIYNQALTPTEFGQVNAFLQAEFIPEPSTLLLLGAGAALIHARRRKLTVTHEQNP